MAQAINGDLYAASGINELGAAPTCGSAAWAAVPAAHAGTYSAALTHAVTNVGSVYVQFAPQAGITAANLATFTANFWHYIPATASNWVQMELRFTAPCSTTPNGANHVDVTIMALQGYTGTAAWVQTSITNASMANWYGNDAAGTGFGDAVLQPLTGILADIDATMTVTATTWQLTRVRMELWEGIARTCYVDDVTLLGGTYPMEPVALFKSVDGGHSWATSISPYKYAGGPVVDMVCSSLYEDVLYVTDGNYVYKSVDGGTSFAPVAAASLEYALEGKCGIPITDNPITCIDVGYDGNDSPVVFIGTKNVYHLYDTSHPMGTPAHIVVGSVYFIADESFPAEWHDLQLRCYGCCTTAWAGTAASCNGCYDAYAVGCAPNFATSHKVYVVVTSPDNDCAGGAGTAETDVIYTLGTVCNWTKVSELCWNCVATNHFGIYHASRIAFPSYYATLPTLFVGVAACGAGAGGDVYRVADSFPATAAIDLNVIPGGGCEGYDTNICSLDIRADDALMAGAWNNTYVFYSYDGGWTWASSNPAFYGKSPTGVDRTYVLWYGESALASTRWRDCAVSMSCGNPVGYQWNQISLISMSIDEVLDLDHAPGYLDGSSIMYVLTYDADCAPLEATVRPNTSLFKWDGTYWERGYSSYLNTGYAADTSAPGAHQGRKLFDWVQVSPDFNETSCVFLASTGFRMLRTMDTGCFWSALLYPCAPYPVISAWEVKDSETVLAAGAVANAGTIFRTTYHGAQPWTPILVRTCEGGYASAGVDFDLSPNIANDNSVLFGDLNGQVFITKDLGLTWGEIQDPYSFGNFGVADTNTYVVFDPNYGTADDPGENMIYAAAGSRIGRCDLSAAPLCRRTGCTSPPILQEYVTPSTCVVPRA